MTGDSFTAGRTSYAGILQDTLREWRVINAAVSGTGVLQALYMAPNRFAQFRPAIFLYQTYVGNDLFDIRYPPNWHTVSLARNVYWFLANHLRVIGYPNYRLRQVQETLTSRQRHALSLIDTVVAASAIRDTGAFSVEDYDPRIKIYLRAEPSLIEDSISCKASASTTMQYSWRAWRNSSPTANQACRAYILVMPHVCQVEAAYLTYLSQLGAHFTTPAALVLPEYPFLVRLREHVTAWPNVDVVNPLPRLRQAHAQQAVYYANDEHLNPAGQQEIAALLRQQLHLR